MFPSVVTELVNSSGSMYILCNLTDTVECLTTWMYQHDLRDEDRDVWTAGEHISLLIRRSLRQKVN
jgi:hypothetical protein